MGILNRSNKNIIKILTLKYYVLKEYYNLMMIKSK